MKLGLPSVLLGLVLAVLLACGGLRALGFLIAYARIDEEMSFEDVDSLLSSYERKDFYNGLLGLDEPPRGGIWFCELGGTSDFNRIQVRFVEGRVATKSIHWD